MRLRRDLIIQDTLSSRLVHFDDGTVWRLDHKLSEKAWEGCLDGDGESDPYEAHAVFDCTQVRGQQPGKEAIIKARIE